MDEKLFRTGIIFSILYKFVIFIHVQENATFVRTSNNKKQMRFNCKYGYERDSRSTGKRIRLHPQNLDCPAFVNFYKSQRDGDIGMTSFSNEHNHPRTKELFKRQNVEIDKDDENLIETLLMGNCNPTQIKKVLKDKHKKELTIGKLRYKIGQLVGNQTEENKDKLESFLEDLEEDGGQVKVKHDPDGSVSVISVMSSTMRKAYIGTDPTVIQVDTSFNFESAKYKLNAICYFNPTTNKGEIAMLSFMADESKKTMEFVFRNFKRIVLRDPPVILVDKDFTEISCLKSVFVASTILLCIFHVLKFQKLLFSTAKVDVEVKQEIMDAFKSMVYSRTEESFLANLQSFYTRIVGIDVRSNKIYVSLRRYFDKNWLPDKGMWAMYKRKELPVLGDNTNNRVERAFGTMKKSIKESFSGSPTTAKALVHLINFCDERLNESYTRAQFQRLKIFDKDPSIRELNNEASKHLNDTGCIRLYTAICLLNERRENLTILEDGIEETFENSDEGKIYETTVSRCNCTFFVQNQCPCRHILLRRESEELPMFEKDLFHERYYLERSEDLEDDLGNISFNNNDEDDEDEQDKFVHEVIDDTFAERERTALNPNQKHNIIYPELLKISNLVASHGTKKFLQYVEEFRKVENIVRKGGNIFKEEREIQSEVVADEPRQSESDGSEVDRNSSRQEILHDTLPEEQYQPVAGPSTGEQSSKFKLKFKKALKMRGRPKGAMSQVSFKPKKVKKKKAVKDIEPDQESESDQESERDQESESDQESDMDVSESELDFSNVSDPYD